jgi:type I restriction enzyme S subunit
LLNLRIAAPPREVQDRIGRLLDTCDREIALLEQLVDALERQKRALLDKLLSGELRLPAT